MTFTKFDAVKKFVAVKLKNPTMRISPMTTGRTPRFPDLRFPIARCQMPSCSSESGGPRSEAATSSRAHATTPASASATPATFVGIPAVIACTTSCCVRLGALVDADVTAEAEDRDPCRRLEDVVQVVRDEDDGEPLLGQPPDELQHLLGLRDAERRGGLVEDDELGVPHHRSRDGDGLALPPRERRDRLTDGLDRRHPETLERLRRALLHRRLLEPEEDVPDLPAEVHVLDDVEVVAEREVLVHDLDPEIDRVLRPVDA